MFALLVLSAPSLDAGVILSDSFTYPDGPVTNAPGSPWVTHSSSAANEEGLVVSGKLQLTYARGDDVNALLSGQPYTTGGGATLYASFTVNFSALPTSGGSYFAHFKDNSTGYRARIWASTTGASGGSFRLGIGNSSSAAATSGQLTNNLALNTTHTIVARYNVGTGVSTIWLNPEAESDPSVTASDTPGPISITSFALRQSSGMGALLMDDLKVGTTFGDVAGAATQPPIITTSPQSQMAVEGSNVTFTVMAAGNPSPAYQWQFNGTNLADATASSLTLTNVTTAQAGTYIVVVTNTAGSTNSKPATLTVRPPSATFSLLTYNTHGNAVEDWSTNSLQVQAIGRQMMYLKPDIITFQEIPMTNAGWTQMTNFVAAYLPGFFLAMNSGSDGYVRSVIASRFPIARSTKWLDGIDLRSFGYSNANNNLDNFTRDLFEAQITVPGLEKPLHVFTVHLKSGQDTDSADKRAAEASAISNWFATVFLPLYGSHPYVLTGDLNESDANQLSIRRLISAPTGLQLTTPVNPYTASELTFSIQAASLTKRYDYILPGTFLFTNITGSQIFRTDKLDPPPPNLNSNDDIVASDHLPVLMVFNKPGGPPFRITSIGVTNQTVTLKWESASDRQYRVDASPDLESWSILATNLTAAGTSFTFSTNVNGDLEFFRVYRAP